MSDVGDIELVGERKSRARLRRENELEAIKVLLSHRFGRDFVWRLLEECRLYQSSYQGNAEEAVFNEGKRNVGLWVLNEVLQAAPNAYATMRQEAEDR